MMTVPGLHIPVSFQLALLRAESNPRLEKCEKTLSSSTNIPPGYRYVGSVIVENHQLKFDNVPPAVHRLSDAGGDVIIHLESETIIENGRMKRDRIVGRYYASNKEYPFLCC